MAGECHQPIEKQELFSHSYHSFGFQQWTVPNYVLWTYGLLLGIYCEGGGLLGRLNQKLEEFWRQIAWT